MAVEWNRRSIRLRVHVRVRHDPFFDLRKQDWIFTRKIHFREERAHGGLGREPEDDSSADSTPQPPQSPPEWPGSSGSRGIVEDAILRQDETRRHWLLIAGQCHPAHVRGDDVYFGHDALRRDEGHKVAIEKTEMMISCTHFGVQK